MAGLSTEPLTVGSTIFVDLPEHGISADFTVSAILPCPTPNPGDGYLVTTKFIHENAEILDLRIEGSDEPIGTTASHPFWSEDRQDFVQAGSLEPGEHLRLADGRTFEADGLVGADGLLSVVRSLSIGDGPPHPPRFARHLLPRAGEGGDRFSRRKAKRKPTRPSPASGRGELKLRHLLPNL